MNTERETEIARQAVLKVLGKSGLAEMEHPSMGGEDFAYYLLQIPGCYVRFGACRRGCEQIPLHSPSFDFDESILALEASMLEKP